jgi:hypothetical protein
MAFDYIFKRVMEDLLKSCGAKAEKVGTLPLEIDAVARCEDGRPVETSIPLLAKHFSRDNLFEYKSEVDKASKESFSKLLGYVGLYGDQHGIGIHEMRGKVTGWYITARRPGFLDEMLVSKIATKTSDAGMYEVVAGFPCPCRVVVCDELDVNDVNIPLLFLGSVETVKKAIVQLSRAKLEMRQAMGNVISMIYLFYRDKVKNMTEIKGLLPPDVLQSVKHTIIDIGIEKVVKEIGMKAVVDAVGIDEVIKSVGIDEVIKSVGIDEVIKSAGIDEIIDSIGADKLKEALTRREAGKKPAKKAGKK